MTGSITPPPAGTTFTKDPVLITTVVFFILFGVASLLTATGVFSDTVGGIIVGIITVLWGGIQLMMVKPATVPRQPLAELAYENQQPAGSVMPPSTQVVEVADLPIDQQPPTGATQ
jgi:hypothetical protein